MNNKVNCNSIEIIKKRFTLTGFSEAARNTGFRIPELRFALDCGVLFQSTPECIFITHGHIDHTSEIAKTLIDTGTIHPKIFCPTKITERIRNVIHAFFVLTKNTDKPKVHNKYSLTGVDSGTKIPLSYDKKDKKRVSMFVEIIPCYHTVPCVGYGFSEVRRKLRPEFHGLSQEALNTIKMRKDENGNEIDISHDVEYPLFCFMGDTNERALYCVENDIIINNPVLEKYQTIIIECTFLDPEHYEHAKKDRHMHWSKLEPYVRSHPETRFILIHFSTRYSNDYIEKFFEKTGYTNIVPFIQTRTKNSQEQQNKKSDYNNECCTNYSKSESSDGEVSDDVFTTINDSHQLHTHFSGVNDSTANKACINKTSGTNANITQFNGTNEFYTNTSNNSPPKNRFGQNRSNSPPKNKFNGSPPNVYHSTSNPPNSTPNGFNYPTNGFNHYAPNGSNSSSKVYDSPSKNMYTDSPPKNGFSPNSNKKKEFTSNTIKYPIYSPGNELSE